MDALMCQLDVPGAPQGPLHGLRFAAKDCYDVAGVATGLGNPQWPLTHPVPTKNAAAVQRLLDAGAHLVGKTVMDEIAYGLTGRNVHYGTPTNPAAPDRVPGGSSSGSAAAVAGGLVDFALGGDTGGSIRVPSSWCGLFGMRPTWGRVDATGCGQLAPTYDTVAWCARDGEMLRRVGRVLLRLEDDAGGPAASVPTLLVCDDLFALAEPAARDSLEHAVDALSRTFEVRRGRLDADTTRWAEAFRTLQGFEVWQTFGAWLEAEHPDLADDIAQRLSWCKTLRRSDLPPFMAVREAARDRVRKLTLGGVIICFPTTPGIALPRDFDARDMEALRARLQALTCIAGLSSAPQISVPLGTSHGAPCGLSFLGAPGSDDLLLDLAAALNPN